MVWLLVQIAIVQVDYHPCEAGRLTSLRHRSLWWICRILDVTRRYYVPWKAHSLVRSLRTKNKSCQPQCQLLSPDKGDSVWKRE